MSTALRIATFNLENLEDSPNQRPTLENRITIMRPQLERIRADFLCLQEVHGQEPDGPRSLDALQRLISGTSYENYNITSTRTVGGQFYDKRNVVILSRLPITESRIIRDSDIMRPSYQFVTANPADQEANPVSWERPILYAQIQLDNGRILHLVNLHLKSKIATTVAGQKINSHTWRTASAWAEGSFVSSMKRVGQALQTRILIDQIFDEHGLDSLIAVCGDFNAEAKDVPLRAIIGHVEDTGNAEHGPRMMIPCENNVPESNRFSLLHLGKGQMLDHIIASRALIGFFSGAEIHNEALPDESGAFKTDLKFPESDHAPVVAEFIMP